MCVRACVYIGRIQYRYISSGLYVFIEEVVIHIKPSHIYIYMYIYHTSKHIARPLSPAHLMMYRRRRLIADSTINLILALILILGAHRRINPQSRCTIASITSQSGNPLNIINIITAIHIIIIVVFVVILRKILIWLRQKLQRLPLTLRNRVAAGVSMQDLVVVSASFVMEAAGAQVFATGFVAGGCFALDCWWS